MKLVEYLDEKGRSPFGDWFDRLNAPAAAKIAVALVRMEQGNFANAKSVGAGVEEFRVHFGPGYRLYFGREGDELVILLAGGSKSRQQRDIAAARERWQDYKDRREK